MAADLPKITAVLERNQTVLLSIHAEDASTRRGAIGWSIITLK
jgi:hypothetical protein